MFFVLLIATLLSVAPLAGCGEPSDVPASGDTMDGGGEPSDASNVDGAAPDAGVGDTGIGNVDAIDGSYTERDAGREKICNTDGECVSCPGERMAASPCEASGAGLVEGDDFGNFEDGCTFGSSGCGAYWCWCAEPDDAGVSRWRCGSNLC